MDNRIQIANDLMWDQSSNAFRNHYLAACCWLLALPEDLRDKISGRLPPADHRALGSTCQRHRAIWEASELKRLEGQPPDVAALPLHQRQAFLQPIAPPVVSRVLDAHASGRLAAGVHIHSAVYVPHPDPIFSWHWVLARMSDGSAWGRGGCLDEEFQPLPVPSRNAGLPGRLATVRSLAAWGDRVVLAREEDGAVLASSRLQDRHHLSHLQFQRVALDEQGAERAVKVCAGNKWTYVLTEAGYVWGWGGIPLPGLRMDANESKPQLVEAVLPFALMDACEGTLFAVDRKGGMYACGCNATRWLIQDQVGAWQDDGFNGFLVPLPPPPAPVRDIYAGSGNSPTHVLGFDGERQFLMSRMDNDESKCVGPLALLVDGTVWSVSLQRRLPFCEQVVAFGRDPDHPDQVVFLKRDRQRLSAAPADLLRLSGWL